MVGGACSQSLAWKRTAYAQAKKQKEMPSGKPNKSLPNIFEKNRNL